VPKRSGHEFRGIKNVNGGPCQVSGLIFAIAPGGNKSIPGERDVSRSNYIITIIILMRYHKSAQISSTTSAFD
jgi:hypothetical protein